MELTRFAPAERASTDSIAADRARLESEPVLASLIGAMPNFAVILNEQRQIVMASRSLLQALGVPEIDCLAGKRPGEAVACVQSGSPGGCGTATACSSCGAVQAILESMETGGEASHECRIRSLLGDGQLFDFAAKAAPLQIGDRRFTYLDLKDISAEKRRNLLERLFFHDLMNTAAGLHGLAQAVAAARDGDSVQHCKDSTLIMRLAEIMIEEIRDQRVLMMAERGEYAPTYSRTFLPGLIAQVEALYRNHAGVAGRHLSAEMVPRMEIQTDPVLLRRVLGNLVKNALEATPEGGTVRLGCRDIGEEVEFRVHNPGVIPKDIQLLLFERSFSTKPGPGRGIGIYSVKLLGEQLLKGKVSFVSREPEGTTFTFTLPAKPAA